MDRNERMSNLEKIIPESIRNEIENSLASPYAFLAGALVGGGGVAGTILTIAKAIPDRNPSEAHIPAIYLGVLFAGLGGIFGWMVNTYSKVKSQSHNNPAIQDEIWEWAERKNYV